MSDARVPKNFCSKHPEAPLVEDYRAGDLVCTQCGKVVADRVIDVSPEWRSFANDGSSAAKDRSRGGIAENALFDDGSNLSTAIAINSRDPNNPDHLSFSRYQKRLAGASENRTMLNSWKEISTMADRMNLPRSIVTKAQFLFKEIQATMGIKGRSSDAVASACLYTACRQEGVPRTFKEVCAAGRVSKKEIGRCFKLVLRHLGTNVDMINSADFMSRFCTMLQMGIESQKLATQISKRVYELELAQSRSPVTISAGAIFLACLCTGEQKSAKDISDISGVAEASIKIITKIFLKNINDLLPPEMVEKLDTSRLA